MTIVCKAKASNLMHVLCVKPDVDLKINARWPRFYASQASAAACIPGKALFTPIPRKNKETMISAPSISSLSVQMHPLQSKTVPLRLITIIHTDQNTQLKLTVNGAALLHRVLEQLSAKRFWNHFSIYACHLCARAMLIFSVSFQF